MFYVMREFQNENNNEMYHTPTKTAQIQNADKESSSGRNAEHLELLFSSSGISSHTTAMQDSLVIFLKKNNNSHSKLMIQNLCSLIFTKGIQS